MYFVSHSPIPILPYSPSPRLANMEILSQFLLRLAFGLAVGMAITPSQKVFSGFYRNHLYVALGLTTFATLLVAKTSSIAAGFAAGAAACSFLGAACWLYEAKRAGITLLWVVAFCALLAALVAQSEVRRTLSIAGSTGGLVASGSSTADTGELLRMVSVATSGLTMGVTIACMFLGHWHLNAPGMELGPLRRLISVAAAAVVLQMLVVGTGLVGTVVHQPTLRFDWLLFITLRWSFGLLGTLALLWMAWQTLKIPNTQSATGMLYVAVCGVFTGELMGLLLSAGSPFPL